MVVNVFEERARAAAPRPPPLLLSASDLHIHSARHNMIQSNDLTENLPAPTVLGGMACGDGADRAGGDGVR